MIKCSASWCTLTGFGCVSVQACVTCTPGESSEHCQQRANELAEEYRAGPLPQNCDGC